MARPIWAPPGLTARIHWVGKCFTELFSQLEKSDILRTYYYIPVLYTDKKIHQVHFPLFGYIWVTSILCPSDQNASNDLFRAKEPSWRAEAFRPLDTIVGDQGMFKRQKQLQVVFSQLNTPLVWMHQKKNTPNGWRQHSRLPQRSPPPFALKLVSIKWS